MPYNLIFLLRCLDFFYFSRRQILSVTIIECITFFPYMTVMYETANLLHDLRFRCGFVGINSDHSFTIPSFVANYSSYLRASLDMKWRQHVAMTK